MDQETALLSLRNINETVTDKTLQCLNDIVLSDPDFFTSPGGTVHHHNFKHGLVIHTAEVMMNAFMMSHGRMSDELITAAQHCRDEPGPCGEASEQSDSIKSWPQLLQLPSIFK